MGRVMHSGAGMARGLERGLGRCQRGLCSSVVHVLGTRYRGIAPICVAEVLLLHSDRYIGVFVSDWAPMTQNCCAVDICTMV